MLHHVDYTLHFGPLSYTFLEGAKNGKEQIFGSSCLRYCAYRKMIADKTVFVRFLGRQKTNSGPPWLQGRVAVSVAGYPLGRVDSCLRPGMMWTVEARNFSVKNTDTYRGTAL